MVTDPRSDAATIAATPMPPWASGYKFEVLSDGRPWLHATLDGFEVWAQPRSWSTMNLKPKDVPPGDAAGFAVNGVQLSGLQAHAGRFETNDASFGREILGARAGSEVPMPDGPRGRGADVPWIPCTAILVVGMLAAAIVARFKRRAV
jgi:hypothetical protein